MQLSVLESEHELRWTPPSDSARASASVVTTDATRDTDTTVGQSELCSLSSDLDDEGIGESDSDIRTRSCHSSDGVMASDVGCGPLHLHSTNTNDIHSYISESIHRQNLADARDLAGAEPGSKLTVVDDVTVGVDTAQTELEGSIHNGGTSSSGGSSSTLVDCGKDPTGGASDEDVAKLPCENWELEDSGKESAENSDEEYRRYFRATLTKSTDPSERGKLPL
ncbi:hypothetical protein NP493_152g00015 [Ridgeia piscesae]|uniref:Uncharacterized protein n=1 Tax=Ridgeia piscesae TaxID=27915 RepID=A0AAD9P498_RIDPI|nr:hypothetical protein NP493_152g00015 [Ridgeia piscesae]